MTQPIEYLGQPGLSLYAMVRLNGRLWNVTLQAFEDWNSAHWADYAIALTEQVPSGYYSAAYPESIPAGSLTTEVLYIQAELTPAIGDAPLSPGQSQGTNVVTVGGSGAAALGMAASAKTIVSGQAVTGTLTTRQATTTLTGGNSGQYGGRTIVFVGGANTNAAAAITGYNPSTGLLSFTQLPTPPANGDPFIII